MNLLILQPTHTLLDTFTSITSPMFEIIHTLRIKNANLRQTRDLLLPKLIAGDVDVEGLEIAEIGDTREVEMKAVEV